MRKIDQVKSQKWFYEFKLPDGSVTESYIDEAARPIHTTREKVLRRHLASFSSRYDTALDISSHEGYFSLVLLDYIAQVTGIDKNANSVARARLITSLYNREGLSFKKTSMEKLSPKAAADFVLCYGLLYHVENPVQVLRKLSEVTKKTLCIETQVMPFEHSGQVEDGHYKWLRDVNGLFGLFIDYSQSAEGGLTDIAVVPSRRALEFLLKEFGFKTVDFYVPEDGDYEQFTRHKRVILFAEK